MVDVIEHYRDWVPPRAVRAAVDRLLAATPPPYKLGLGSIVLTNSGSLTGSRRRGKTTSRKRKVALARCLGLYYRARRGQLASIEIFVDNCLRRLPRQLHNVPLFVDFQVGPTFFHELGHHIHSTVAREYAEREDVADRWSRQLFRAYARRQYRWLLVLLYPARPLFWLWSRYRRTRRPARAALGAPSNPSLQRTPPG